MTSPLDQNVHFHRELDALEQSVLGVVDIAYRMLDLAVEAVTNGDLDLVDQVVELDNQVDGIYFETHQQWTTLIARNQPMGSDLRRMDVLHHLNITFERMSAQCVNIAKVARSNKGLPPVQTIVSQIREMGDLVKPMLRTAVDAYVRQDMEEARLLPAMDEPVDRLNANMYKETIEVAGNKEMLEWATKMILVARALERIGDQAVDFAEQTAYLISGERASFDEAGLIGTTDESST